MSQDPTVFPSRLDKKVSLQPGETLFKEGDPEDALYVISSGTVLIIHTDEVYEDVQAGDILGEMVVVDEGMPRSASAVATIEETHSSEHFNVFKILGLVIPIYPYFSLHSNSDFRRKLANADDLIASSATLTAAAPLCARCPARGRR